ncbi:sensor histidine kinase [Cohnella suwonensis]|uniref:histidine kinase n=1 Tax=Cohnella suwonensis TaxID=696072 RepID=A0ABW0LX66_9BACL
MTGMKDLQGSPLRMPAAVRMTRWPLMGWIALVCIGTLILLSVKDLQFIPLLFFGGLMLLHASLLWHSETLTNKRPWLYFLVQALLINGAAYLVPDGSPVFLVALNPVMIGQSVAVYRKKRYIIVTFVVYYLMFSCTAAYIGDAHLLALLLPLYLLMTLVVMATTQLAIRQLQAQRRTQSFLAELEIAHLRVEELTISNERQRMARDLHDTLAQGLAGLIMQLEAVDAHLSADNPRRAQEIVHQSMERARRTMAEARQVIDNLRAISASHADFVQILNEEIERYRQESGIRVHIELDPPNPLSKLLTEHCLHIVRECLANVSKHTQADQVWILMKRAGSAIRLEIRDDGQGFDPAQIGKQPGHYGLLGIQERVRIIGGSFEVQSDSKGTMIRIQVPLGKGEANEA